MLHLVFAGSSDWLGDCCYV